jgi:hypothetical protein
VDVYTELQMVLAQLMLRKTGLSMELRVEVEVEVLEAVVEAETRTVQTAGLF